MYNCIFITKKKEAKLQCHWMWLSKVHTNIRIYIYLESKKGRYRNRLDKRNNFIRCLVPFFFCATHFLNYILNENLSMTRHKIVKGTRNIVIRINFDSVKREKKITIFHPNWCALDPGTEARWDTGWWGPANTCQYLPPSTTISDTLPVFFVIVV